MWSLELASEVFHDFFAYDLGGKDAHSAGRNSRKSAVAVEMEFGSTMGNWVTKIGF